MDDIVIRVENLGKCYRLGELHCDRLSDAIASGFNRLTTSLSRLFSPNGSDRFTADAGRGPSVSSKLAIDQYLWALRDVSFHVKRGEVWGIIGRNGTGKSTLLKILSGITEPTEGRVWMKGRVASLLEVGTGFHPDLTGRENVFLNGSILGMTKAEIRKRFDEIAAFAELEKFIDTPVKRYSSGMYVRLAFSVAAHLQPEILLVDEVLAVGDAEFQKKCLGKIGDVSREGRTVLFVSHNMAAVENLCGSALLLDQGKVKFTGNKTEAIVEYQRSGLSSQSPLMERSGRKGSGEVRVVRIEFRDVDGYTIDTIASGQDVDIVFHFESSSTFEGNRVVAGFMIKDLRGLPVFLHHNRMTGDEFGRLPSRGEFVCSLKRIPLVPSVYTLDYSINIGHDYLDHLSDASELHVIAGKFCELIEIPPISHGVCLVEGRWRIEY